MLRALALDSEQSGFEYQFHYFYSMDLCISYLASQMLRFPHLQNGNYDNTEPLD